MKNVVIVLLGILLLSIVPASIYAQSQIPRKDYFAADKTVVLHNDVTGDAYLAGGNVTVDGNIGGDLLVAGGSVTIQGTVGGNVRAAGGTIYISGSVGKNVTVAGGNVNITDTATIGGNVVAGVGNLLISGIVNGDLTYASEAPADVTMGRVSGNVTKFTPPKDMKRPDINVQEVKAKAIKGIAGFFVIAKIIGFLSSLLIGLILIHLLPTYSKRVVTQMRTEFWKSLGLGFLIMVMLPVTIVMLLITIVGIPIAIVLIFASCFLMYLSHILASFVAGYVLSEKFGKKMSANGALVFGLLVFFVLSFVPIFGKMLIFFVSLAATGAIIAAHTATYKELRNKKLV